MIDTNELRRLAQAATHPVTKGRWMRLFGERTVYDRMEDGCRGIPVVSTPFSPPHPFEAACLDFIAAANPAVISELLDRLEDAEKERDDVAQQLVQSEQGKRKISKECESYKAAYNDWADKTEWVQQGFNEGAISAKYLGLHRADVMARLLDEAEKERDFAKTEIARLHDDIRELTDERVLDEEDRERIVAHPQGEAKAKLYRLEAAEKELAELRSSMKFRTSLIGRTEAERDALRAKISDLTINVEYLGNLKKSYEELIGELQDERDELRAKIEATEEDRLRFLLEMGRLCAQCDALRAEVIHTKEVEFPRKAQAVADGWRSKCERLEAKIAEMEQQEPVAWYSKRYGFVYMSRQPSQFERGSILYLRNGAPAWRIEGSSKVALLDMASLPHGTVFYALPGAQTQGEEK